jgi:hypothetical protein
LLAEHTSLAVAAALAAAALVLLAGSQLLHPGWLFGIALLATLLAGRGIWGRMPDSYRLAQSIDQRLDLNDALSTAVFFAGDGSRIAALQREQAAATASAIRPEQAVPFHVPRSLVAAAVALAVASGLFLLRYGLTRSLDLRPSLVQIAFEPLFGPASDPLARRKGLPTPKALQVPDTENLGQESDPTAEGLQLENLLAAGNEGEGVRSDAPGDAKSKASGPASQEPGDGPGKGEQSGSEADSQNEGNSEKSEAAKSGPQGSPPGQQGQQSAQNSLLDKMRDAMSSLMNKLKGQDRSGEPQHSPGQQPVSQQQARPQPGQKGQQGQRQSQQNASESGEQAEQEGEGQRADASQAAGQQKSADAAGPKDGKSGVGQQDGSKETREAEQLEAMGKLSEIIGKRSATLSGEVMVEVNSTKQGIRTPYSDKSATHADTGGNLTRDEVPLLYRQYVQRYFEEVRPAPKSPGARQ